MAFFLASAGDARIADIFKLPKRILSDHETLDSQVRLFLQNLGYAAEATSPAAGNVNITH